MGYFLEFDVAMINRVSFPILGMGSPHEKIEVTGLYYKYQQLRSSARDHTTIYLLFDTLTHDLGLPMWPTHDAVNAAVQAFLKQRHLQR